MTVRMSLAVALAAMSLCCPERGASAEENAGQPAAHTTVRLAQMRAVPEKWNLEANFKVFLELLEEADKHEPDFFITPEGWLDGYASPHETSTRRNSAASLKTWRAARICSAYRARRNSVGCSSVSVSLPLKKDASTMRPDCGDPRVS